MAWILTGLAFVLALAAWIRARGLARRLDQLTQQYWDLRYQHGHLRARVNRLDPDADAGDEAPVPAPPPQTFIPLSSLKR